MKTKNELRSARRSSSLARSKIDFARRVTEQRMSNCLSTSAPDMEEEIISLYSTMLDEESFTLEGDDLVPGDDFLKVVEEKIVDIPTEMEKLKVVKNKILEKVKEKKVNRQQSRERRESMSSICSSSSKRGSTEQGGVERGRPRVEVSSMPKLVKS